MRYEASTPEITRKRRLSQANSATSRVATIRILRHNLRRITRLRIILGMINSINILRLRHLYDRRVTLRLSIGSITRRFRRSMNITMST